MELKHVQPHISTHIQNSTGVIWFHMSDMILNPINILPLFTVITTLTLTCMEPKTITYVTLSDILYSIFNLNIDFSKTLSKLYAHQIK